MTGDAEFDAAEELVRQAVERIEGSGYVAQGVAAAFLAELAYKYRQRDARVMMVSTVAGQPQWKWPRDMSKEGKQKAVVTLFADSGIATTFRDALRFVPESVCRYLAASHLVRHNQDGRWRLFTSKISKYVACRSVPWHEDDEEFTRFLVHRWWPTAQPAVTKHLGKFLKKPNRDPNIFFIAGLCHRGMLSGSDLRDRTVDALREEVGTAQRAESVWQQMAGWLHTLDPAAAVVELDAAIRSPKQDMTVWRAFAAVTELTSLDPEMGAAGRTHLAEHLWGEPEDQVGVAIRIGEADPALAERTLVRLSRDPDIGEWRVKAALHVDEPSLWHELIKDARLSDDGRWSVFDRLVERDTPIALTAARVFVSTAHEERTRLSIAKLIKDDDFTLAWESTADVAFTTERTVDGWLRLDAILLLYTLDPAQPPTLLEEFSAWSVPPAEVRLQAAVIVADQYGRLPALVALSEAGDVSRTHRKDAARTLGERDRDKGATAFLTIAASCGWNEPDLLDLLRAAYALDPQRTSATLISVAENKNYADDIRVGTVWIAAPSLTVKRRVELYVAIAGTAVEHATAFAVAMTARDLDPDAGRRVFAVVAERHMPVELRLQAAEEAGKRGKGTLIGLGQRGNLPKVRLAAAHALSHVDRSASYKIAEGLVRTPKIGLVRVHAALCLSPTNVVPVLIWIVGESGEQEEVRCAAAKEAMLRDEESARWLLTQLQPSLSPHMSAYIASLLLQ